MMTAVLFIAGLALLVGGAELLVRGASRFAAAFGISPLIIGLTVVAYGTSAPEFAVSIQAAASGQAGVSVGNVVGSNIFNVLFILGVSALIGPLVISRKLVRLDIWVMLGTALLPLALGLDGVLTRGDGLLLALLAVGYTAWCVWEGKRESQAGERDFEGSDWQPEKPGRSALLGNLVFAAAGLGLLILGANWLVESSVTIARALGLSELIIGLTIIAAGTSLPEVATSVLAALRGQRDIAVGNVVGSSIFNILFVLGGASALSPSGIRIPAEALRFDIPVMVAVSVACIPIFFTGYRIDRWEGGLFLGYYVAYTAYLTLEATKHTALELYRTALIWFVLPLTAVTLLVLALRALRAHRSPPGANGA